MEGITLAAVDEKGRPISGTEEDYECDTLLLSVGLIPENELSGQMGAELNPVTSGPVVNESLETSVAGVFACGNVLHVHDLVDFVSEEAEMAGQNAALYVKKHVDKSTENGGGYGKVLPIQPSGGVRYTVPSFIRPDHMEDRLTVRFRVGSVYRKCYVSVYLGEERIIHKKRPVMAPGEMEEIRLEKSLLLGCNEDETIRIRIEEA